MVFLYSRALTFKYDFGNPFIIALFCGKPKSVDELLSDFIEKHQRLAENGIVLENTTKPFKLKGFTYDAPAIEMLKSTKVTLGTVLMNVG